VHELSEMAVKKLPDSIRNDYAAYHNVNKIKVPQEYESAKQIQQKSITNGPNIRKTSRSKGVRRNTRSQGE
jgi:formiminotetrahydrofolate cyclodeaminase